MRNLLTLSRGPTRYVTSCSGYIVNGYRFHIQSRERTLRTQNSGVVVMGNSGNGHENIDYYGVVIEILEMQYHEGNRVVLFRCKWWDVHDKVRGIKTDEYGFVSVNPNKQLKTIEPFILASQARQVFYVTYNANKGWQLVVKNRPHIFCDMEDDDNDKSNKGDAYQCSELFPTAYIASSSTTASAEVYKSRVDIDPEVVEDISKRRTTEKGCHKRRRE
ncbi:unnamed protein product, partial [Cuscuta europaea]